jgi:hypothetical protein
MKWMTILFCLMSLYAQLNKGNKSSSITPNGETKIAGMWGKRHLVALFYTSTVAVDLGDKIPRFAQCTYSRVPCVMTRKIALSIEGQEIFVPRSAYADLGDIQSAEFSFTADKLSLIIKGGDASESYVAHLIFDHSRALERQLYSGEDISHALETTYYHEVSMD